MNWQDAALVVFMVGVCVPLYVVLTRYRDRLTKRFSQDMMTVHGMRHIGDGIKLCVVDVEGMRVLCAYGRNGQPVLQVIGLSPAPETPANDTLPVAPSAVGGVA
ncbi:MAG: hypothetical protein EBS72_01840 [Rhizobiales bacterium]|jgi:hypothetical protein|nr:hypothetical protein [Hyphomicrobiales bacterium]